MESCSLIEIYHPIFVLKFLELRNLHFWSNLVWTDFHFKIVWIFQWGPISQSLAHPAATTCVVPMPVTIAHCFPSRALEGEQLGRTHHSPTVKAPLPIRYSPLPVFQPSLGATDLIALCWSMPSTTSKHSNTRTFPIWGGHHRSHSLPLSLATAYFVFIEFMLPHNKTSKIIYLINNCVYCIHATAYFVVSCSAFVFYFVSRSCATFKFEFEFESKANSYSLWRWAETLLSAQPSHPYFSHVGLAMAQAAGPLAQRSRCSPSPLTRC
jgi:hypothetical protein